MASGDTIPVNVYCVLSHDHNTHTGAINLSHDNVNQAGTVILIPGGIVTIDTTPVTPNGLKFVTVTVTDTGVPGNGVCGDAIIVVVTSGSTKPKLFSILSSDLNSTI